MRQPARRTPGGWRLLGCTALSGAACGGAAPQAADASLPDAVALPSVDGDFVLAVDATHTPGIGGVVRFAGTMGLDRDAGRFQLTLVPIDARSSAIIIGALELTGGVSHEALTITSFVGPVPAAASPGAVGFTFDASAAGTILDGDHFCGTVSGAFTAASSMPLVEATFGAVRVASFAQLGAITPMLRCP